MVMDDDDDVEAVGERGACTTAAIQKLEICAAVGTGDLMVMRKEAQAGLL
jgi:hypothetical protein